VGKDNINVIELQVLQTLKSTFNDMFPGKTSSVVGLFSVGTEEDLGSNDIVSSVLSCQLGMTGARTSLPIRTL